MGSNQSKKEINLNLNYKNLNYTNDILDPALDLINIKSIYYINNLLKYIIY